MSEESQQAASFIARYLEARGLKAETCGPRGGMPNVVAALGHGRPCLVLSGHMDVFPAGEGWASRLFRKEGIPTAIFGPRVQNVGGDLGGA